MRRYIELKEYDEEVKSQACKLIEMITEHLKKDTTQT